jgi:hypothetical protein
MITYCILCRSQIPEARQPRAARTCSQFSILQGLRTRTKENIVRKRKIERNTVTSAAQRLYRRFDVLRTGGKSVSGQLRDSSSFEPLFTRSK